MGLNMKPCACGCGGIVHRERSNFLPGHQNIGKKYSEERKKNIGKANSLPKHEVVCQFCGKIKLVSLHRLAGFKFCSLSCKAKANLEKAKANGFQAPKGKGYVNKGSFLKGQPAPAGAFPKGNIPWNKGTRQPRPISEKISGAISCAVRRMAKGQKNYTKWQELVGWGFEDFKKRIGKLLKPGMTWENHGSVWHIDHIIPISAFNIISIECIDFKRCWKLKNLQPLFVKENISKLNKLLAPFQPALALEVESAQARKLAKIALASDIGW
jgi:hypothetical protein